MDSLTRMQRLTLTTAIRITSSTHPSLICKPLAILLHLLIYPLSILYSVQSNTFYRFLPYTFPGHRKG